MTTRICPAMVVMTSAVLAFSSPALACGGGSLSFVGSMQRVAEQTPDLIANLLGTVLNLGATLTRGRAEGATLSSPASPSATSAVAGLIAPLGQIAAEQAITDYKVSGYQRQMIEVYGPMIADGQMNVESATNAVMAANYAPGAGRTAVERALQDYADGLRIVPLLRNTN